MWNKLHIIVLLLVVSLSMQCHIGYSQDVLGKWILETEQGSVNYTHLITFYDNNTIGDETLTSVNPDDFCEFAAGGYMPSYDLQFYILGEWLYFEDDSHNWNDIATPNECDFHPEFQIINKPGEFDKYFCFFSQSKYNDAQDSHLNYFEVSFDALGNPLTTIFNIFAGIHQDYFISFAITEEDNEVRYLYAITAGNTTGNDASLKKWEITSSGIDPQSFEVIIDEDDPNLNEEDFSGYNLEMKVTSSSDTYIAWITASESSNFGQLQDLDSKLYILEVDGVDPLSIYDYSTHGNIAGIEFSPINDNLIYLSTTSNGIIEVNYLTGAFIEDKDPNNNYTRTYLQTAPDGHIYAVANGGNSLGRLNMGGVSVILEDNQIQFGIENVLTYREHSSEKYFILPENDQEYCPLSATLELEHVCPDECTGEAMIDEDDIICGHPPYQYTWYDEGMNIISHDYYVEDLCEGNYSVVLMDASDHIFSEEFEIIIDPELYDHEWVVVTYNQEWPGYDDRYLYGIRVTSGNELKIIDSDLKFLKPAKIIVERGARLIIDNSKLSYYVDCHRKWLGIEVWGTPGESQYEEQYHGYLELINNSEVSYAENGVVLFERDENNDIIWGTGGGIIRSNNTNFINNTKSVHFIPYRNFNPYDPSQELMNRSGFTKDTFDINIDNIGYNIFYKHADLHGVNGINFKGCAFKNTDVNYVSTYNLGIAAYGGGFSVKSYCNQPATPCPPEHEIKSSFDGFYWAIGTYSSEDWIHTFSVRDAEFTNNRTGIYVSGVNYGVMINNDFEIGLSSQGDGTCGNPEGFGIDIHQAFGFAVENNSFTKYSQALPGEYAGIRVYWCPSPHDIIYKNSFDGLSFGNYAEGTNRELPGNDETGVEYRCNNNMNNAVDFIVTDSEQLWDAKIRDLQGNSDIASGNTFSQDPCTQWHFKNEGEEVVTIWCYLGDPLQVPDEELITYYFVQIPTTAAENTCPDHYGGGGNIELTAGERQQKELEYTQNLNDYNAVLSLYESFKDGGNTPAELTDIQTAQPDDMWALRAQLLGDSPHLSQEVLMETSDRTDVFPDDVLFDILAANPDELKEDTLISYLENKEDPLPGYMIDILRQLAISNTTYKTILKEQLAEYHAGKTQAAQDIIRSILCDTVVDINDYRNWLDNLGSLGADKQIIASYLSEGDTTSAMSLMNMLSTLYNLQGDELDDFNDYKNLVQMQINWKQAGKNIFELDSTDIAVLEIYAFGNSGTAQNMARNILSYAYDYHFCNCMHINDSSYFKSNTSIAGALNKAFGPEISAEPNPASTWAAFNYRMVSEESVGYIKITDISGKEIQQFRVTGKQGQHVWDTRWVKPGVYFYTLTSNGLSKSGKVIVK